MGSIPSTRATSLRRAASSALGFAVFTVLASACVEDTQPGVYAGISTAEITDDGTLQVHAQIEFYGADHPWTFYLDSASLTVNAPAGATTIDAPTVDTSAFPLVIEGSGLAQIDLSAPSPIPPATTLPGYCAGAIPSVAFQISFYVPEADHDVDQAPPLVLASGSASLAPPGLPPASGIFHPKSVNEFPGVLGELSTSTPLFGDRVAVAIGDPSSRFDVYLADADSAQVTFQLLADDLVLTGAPDGTLVAVGAHSTDTSFDAVQIDTRSQGGTPTSATFVSPAASATSTFRVSAALGEAPAVATDPVRVRVAIESSSPLDFGTVAPVSPQEGKYFGSYLATLDASGVVIDAAQAPGDVLAMVPLTGGEELWVYGDLPPTDAPRQLHIERRDATGTPLWSTSVPMLTYSVDVSPTPDGGAFIVALDETSLAQRIAAIRVDGDGELVFARSFAGADGSGTALADGRMLVAFTGSADVGAPEELASAVPGPVLIELDASGVPQRALSLACGGVARIEGTPDGGAMLVVSFTELASIGDDVVGTPAGSTLFVRLDSSL
ncbi:MAG TPA: hypothetical protein VL400_07220 [Polyangiaceae bacterium]|nr:hypothetical protein [Polyangiaceae bacterium]